MLLVYIDESYRRHHEYWLAAMAVDDSKVPELCDSIRATSASIPRVFGIPPDVELHGQHLFHGDHAFSPMKRAPRARIELYRRGVEASTAVDPALFFIGIDWGEEPTNHSDLGTIRLAAFRHMLLEVDAFSRLAGTRCLLIIDEEKTTTERVVRTAKRHQGLRDLDGCPSCILDTPLFTRSHHSSGVQACDLVLFLKSRRSFSSATRDERVTRVLDEWWQAIEPLVQVDRTVSLADLG